MSGKADSVRTILFALGANLAIAVAKSAAAFFTGSSAMLAEAIHSFADSGNQGLLLWGLKQAKRQPTPDYPPWAGASLRSPSRSATPGWRSASPSRSRTC